VYGVGYYGVDFKKFPMSKSRVATKFNARKRLLGAGAKLKAHDIGVGMIISGWKESAV
jgi:hypothetical protein